MARDDAKSCSGSLRGQDGLGDGEAETSVISLLREGLAWTVWGSRWQKGLPMCPPATPSHLFTGS